MYRSNLDVSLRGVQLNTVSCLQHKLRLGLNYPASTGRFWPEVLRAIDSILLAEKHPIGECVVG